MAFNMSVGTALQAGFHSMPRIGIVIHDFMLGGTERTAIRLASAWVDRGAEVIIFCGNRQGPLLGLLSCAVKLAEANPPIKRERRSMFKLGAKAAAYFTEHVVDVLFVPGNYHWPVIPAFASLPDDVRPVIVSQISASLNKPQRGPLRQIAFDLRMRRLLKGADSLVALFDEARDDADRITRLKRAHTIPLAALADDVAPPTGLVAERVIVSAGRLVPEKGFDELIDAFALLDQPLARLIIVGEGPERERLLARARARKIDDRFQLASYVPDIRPWLDEARLFVLPSHFEGFPAVVVEALAAGRPVVATRSTSALRSLINNILIGRLVPVGEPAALAEAIAIMLRIKPAAPDELAARVSHHRIGPVAQKYIDLFNGILALRNAA